VRAVSFLTHFAEEGIGLAPAATWSEVESGLFIFVGLFLFIDAAVSNN